MAIMLLLLVAFAGDEKPPAMKALEQARQSLRAGSVEYTVVEGIDQSMVLSFRARYAKNGDRILEELGDPEGYTRYAFDPERSAFIPKSKLPFHSLHNSDGYWRLLGSTSLASIWKNPDETWRSTAPDARMIGTNPTGGDLSTVILETPGGHSDTSTITSWTEVHSGSRVVVTGRSSSGLLFEWHLDGSRGWNAERIRLVSPGAQGKTTIAECVNELRDYSGTWFPAASTYYRNSVVCRTVSVDRAEFGRADAKERFTGADLGLEPGFSVTPQDFDTPNQRGLRWSGEQLVSAPEWNRLLREGAKNGPTRLRELRGEPSPLYTPEELALRTTLRVTRDNNRVLKRHETPWEKYTAWFITEYSLDADQRQKAQLILGNCQERASNYIAVHEREIADALGQLTSAPSVPASGPATTSNPAQPAIDRAIAAIDGIFESDLKPRLFRLLTPAQQARTATRPSK